MIVRNFITFGFMVELVYNPEREVYVEPRTNHSLKFNSEYPYQVWKFKTRHQPFFLVMVSNLDYDTIASAVWTMFIMMIDTSTHNDGVFYSLEKPMYSIQFGKCFLDVKKYVAEIEDEEMMNSLGEDYWDDDPYGAFENNE